MDGVIDNGNEVLRVYGSLWKLLTNGFLNSHPISMTRCTKCLTAEVQLIYNLDMYPVTIDDQHEHGHSYLFRNQ